MAISIAVIGTRYPNFDISFPLQFFVGAELRLGGNKKLGKLCVMETLNTRVWQVVGFMVAALLVAAVLRHVLHVHVGYSREEIRGAAFVGFLGAMFAWLALCRFEGRH
ncbi:MAG: hypothetical protein GY844_04215 [Bradyrhizobium sp.]|nr:hypothetical protein [Bradyrhizobium sp.]